MVQVAEKLPNVVVGLVHYRWSQVLDRLANLLVNLFNKRFILSLARSVSFRVVLINTLREPAQDWQLTLDVSLKLFRLLLILFIEKSVFLLDGFHCMSCIQAEFICDVNKCIHEFLSLGQLNIFQERPLRRHIRREVQLRRAPFRSQLLDRH